MEEIKTFRNMVKKQKSYAYFLQLTGWDSHTEAPEESFKRRAEMVGRLSGDLFEMETSEEYASVVNHLYEHIGELDDELAREIRLAKKDLDKIITIPKDEYVEYNKLMQRAQKIWEKAKADDDYESFRPVLEKIIDYKKRFIAYYGSEKLPYDVLLDEYEEDMTMKDYDAFFDALKKDLVPFVKEILKKQPKRNDAFRKATYPADKQKDFVRYLMKVLDYDLNRGLLKESVHPFTWNTSPDDVRFTVRYHEDYMFASVFAAIHELGHATYEQGVDRRFDDTLLSSGASMGIHESQSRFYENMIGRSRAFWAIHFSELKKCFPEQLKGVDENDMYQAANKVEASLIRIEADELTYPLHIMLRYELEKKLITGALDTKALPMAWNKLMKEYLNVTPESYSEGVLQDVHWSGGMFGYFPTYALGTAYAAQIYHAMQKDFDIDQAIKDNRLADVKVWLNDRIHRHGKRLSPKALLKKVTGEDFNPDYYINYLKEKYSELYE